MKAKNFAVTAIDVGESCDGHVRLLGVFDTRETAEEFVREDMKDTWDYMVHDEASKIDWNKHEIWADNNYSAGCVWDIHDLNHPDEQEQSDGK